MPKPTPVMKMLQIDVPETLLEAFDRSIEKQGTYPSRSEALRSLMRRFVEDVEERKR